MRNCANLLLVAAPEHTARFEARDPAPLFPGLKTFAGAPDAPVPADLLVAAQVIVVEVDPASPRSIERLKKIGRDHPALPRIAAIANTTVSLVQALVREGVSDVVALPLQVEELLDVALRALDRAKLQSGEQRLAPQVSVIRSTGRCGVTTVLTHLAAGTADLLSARGSVALADLDLQSGAVADYLGAGGSGTIGDLLAAGERLDPDLLRSVARMTGNLAVYAVPSEIQPIESVDTDRMLQVLAMMRRTHAAVLIDLPTDWTNWAVSAVSGSDLIVMVVELSVNSLQQARRRLDLLAQIEVDPARVVIVVNRLERRMFRTIDLSDVAGTLRHETFATLSLDAENLPAAQAQGALVGSVVRKSRFAADVDSLARNLVSRLGLGAT